MAIIVITGDQSAADLLGNSLRNTAISSGKGALLVKADQDGAVQHQIEKIIAGDVFVEGTPADAVNWKPDPQVVFVNAGEAFLAQFEAACPGFTVKLGPVSRLSLG